MHRLWDTIVFHLLNKLKPKKIVEVGAELGINTKHILDYCVENNAHLTTIDPFPLFDIDEFNNKYSNHFDLIKKLSLEVLPSLKDYDLILLDGDHNWYTIFNELKCIEKTFSQENFPFIIFHDISWPYGRRDLYYNPDDIPDEFLNEYDTKGIFPNESKVRENGGLNAHLNNAIYENTPKNGVLTGIEDFINQTDLKLTFKVLNAFHGLGMLYSPNKQYDEFIDEIIINSDIVGVLEEYYLKDILSKQDLISEKNSQIKELNHTITTKNDDFNKLKDDFNKIKTDINKKNQIINELYQEILNNEAIIYDKNQQIKKWKRKNKKLRKQKKELLSSSSWKITSPFRKFKYMLKRFLKKSDKKTKSYSKEENKLWVSLEQSIKTIKQLDELVSIIIPIYNAYEETKNCLESVLKYTKGNYELILIDDNSSDERISELLDSFENHENIKIIRNETNKGFVHNVNFGLENSQKDVILLNSDTIVTPKWLQKLICSAYKNEKIGTVTPVSNNSGVFSVPKINVDNEISKDLGINGMANLVEKSSKRIFMEVPTGNGFCLYIKRDTIDSVGLFDYENFGKGYGEENDFCMRAINKGWTNIIDDTSYIYHKGSSSFSEEKEKLIQKHLKVLDKLYPTYHRDVQKFIKSDNLKTITSTVENALVKKDVYKKNILYVLHGGVGGTPYMTRDLAKGINELYNNYLLVSTGKKMILYEFINNEFKEIGYWKLNSKWYAENMYDNQYAQIYYNILTYYSIDLVHIMHLIHHTFDLPKIAHKLDIKVILSFHDYYYICLSYNLIDKKGNYCGAKCDSHHCTSPMKISKYKSMHYYVDIWRNEVKKMFLNVDYFITTFDIIKEIYLNVYSNIEEDKIILIEHGYDFEKINEKLFEVPSSNKPIKIVFLGNINREKGSKVIKKLYEMDVDSKFEFHFVGNVEKKLLNIGIHHGIYEREDLPNIIRKIKPSFIGIFSIWPEIYCYTLLEAWLFGIPVLGSKFGAVGKRISQTHGGWIFELNNTQKLYNEILDIANDKNEYLSKVDNINNIKFKSLNEMSIKYQKIYDKLLDN